MRATYFISFNAGVSYTQFYPTNEPKVKLTQEAGEIFLRWRVDLFKIGKTKNANLYTTLYTYFYDTTKFGTDIYYQIKENGVVSYEFIAPVLNGKIDTQNSIYECIPDPKDGYRNILQKYNRKYVFPVGVGAEAIFYPDLNTAANFVNVDFDSFDDTASVVTYANATNAEEIARNQLDHDLTTGQVAIIIIKDFAIVGAAPKMQITDLGGTAKSNQVTISANGKYTLTMTAGFSPGYLELSQTDAITGSSGTFSYVFYLFHSSKGGGRMLPDALDIMLNNASWMNLSVATVMSTILFNDPLPTGHAANTPNISTYVTANPTNDYVKEAAAIWNDLYLDKTDSWLATPDPNYTCSLKDIMDILKSKLRVWWYIDEDGHIRIEHEKYFRDYIVQADLTSAIYIKDKPEIDSKIYNYEMADLYNQLNYTEQNEANEDWIAAPITFDPLATSINIKDISINLSTDLSNLIFGTDTSSGSLLLMRAITFGAQKRIDFEESTKTAGNFYLNTSLGWYHLFTYYWELFSEAEDGTLNAVAHVFDHIKEFLKQEKIRFHPVTAIDWKKPFTLAGGKGWLTSAEYEPETGMAEINVGFNPYE